MKIKQTRRQLIEEMFNSPSPLELTDPAPTSRMNSQNWSNYWRVNTWGMIATVFVGFLYILLMVFTEFGDKYLTSELVIESYAVLTGIAIAMCFHKEVGINFNFHFHLKPHKIYPGTEVELEVVVDGKPQSVVSIELSLKMRERIFYLENPTALVRDYYKEIIYQSENNKELNDFSVKFMIPPDLYPSLSTTNMVNDSHVKRYIQDFYIEWCLVIDIKLKNGLTEQVDYVFWVLTPKKEPVKVSEDSGKNNLEYF